MPLIKLRLRRFLPAILVATTTVSGYEEPAYEVLNESAEYEIRQYSPYLVAETTLPGNFDKTGSAAFRLLAGYIFGDNHKTTSDVSDEKKAVRMNMTVPVTRHRDKTKGDATVYRFVMEATYDLDTLPVPNDKRVSLKRWKVGRWLYYATEGE